MVLAKRKTEELQVRAAGLGLPSGFLPNRGSLWGPAAPYGDQLCPGKRAHGFARDALSQKSIKSVLGQP